MAESMKGLKRTCRCGEVTKANVGEKVTLMGWVQKTEQRGLNLCGSARPFRNHADHF